MDRTAFTERKLKMLTKEECENVLSENKIYLKNQMLKKERISHSVYLLNTVTSLLERLIHEHFDNPPLKFEELKEGMWVWDDIDKEYRKVYGKGIYLGDEYLMKTGCKVVFISEDEYFNLIYEPNRFYRKEVQK